MHPQIVVAPAVSQIALESYQLPKVGPTQVLLETRISAISPGTELAWLHHKPDTPGKYPYYPGYSACSVIIEKGDAVTDLEVGQRVASRTSHASHAVVEAEACFPVPDTVSDQDAAVFGLVAIVLQGVRKAQIQLGWRVAILGLGPIGNLAGQISRAAGATQVLGIDPIDWRQEIARRSNFDAVTTPAEAEAYLSSFEAVIEATGVPEAVPTSFQLASRLGHVILLASTRGETENVNFYRDVHKKGLMIMGAHESIRPSVDDHGFYASRDSDHRTALALMAAKRIDVSPLVSDIVMPNDAAQAYERLTNREKGVMLIAFNWT
ncbi:MAG: zinc-binding alcohol dehydrogenase [Chloroflexota bacterium]